MAENNAGSQESLPLSQETHMLDEPISSIVSSDALGILDNWDSIEVPNQYIPMLDYPSEQRRPISSLPASENWPGDHSFSISFDPQKTAKGISWIFSRERNKLYVGKDVPCPVNFSTRHLMSDDVYIRAMPLFSSSDHASENVHRCVNHYMEESNRGVFEAEHLIRCESKSASYENDSITGHHSVLVPYEIPPVGREHSTYLYKFLCFGSCSGGPNRRALKVVFTLEQKGEVIGRQSIDLKVCECPARDYEADEKGTQITVLKEERQPATGLQTQQVAGAIDDDLMNFPATVHDYENTTLEAVEGYINFRRFLLALKFILPILVAVGICYRLKNVSELTEGLQVIVMAVLYISAYLKIPLSGFLWAIFLLALPVEDDTNFNSLMIDYTSPVREIQGNQTRDFTADILQLVQDILDAVLFFLMTYFPGIGILLYVIILWLINRFHLPIEIDIEPLLNFITPTEQEQLPDVNQSDEIDANGSVTEAANDNAAILPNIEAQLQSELNSLDRQTSPQWTSSVEMQEQEENIDGEMTAPVTAEVDRKTSRQISPIRNLTHRKLP